MASFLTLIASYDHTLMFRQVKPLLASLNPIPLFGNTMGTGTRYGKRSCFPG